MTGQGTEAVYWEGRSQSTGQGGLAQELLQEHPPPKINPVTRGGLAWVAGCPGHWWLWATSFSGAQAPVCGLQRPRVPAWETWADCPLEQAPGLQSGYRKMQKKMLLAASPQTPPLRAESRPAILCGSCICMYGHFRSPSQKGRWSRSPRCVLRPTQAFCDILWIPIRGDFKPSGRPGGPPVPAGERLY